MSACRCLNMCMYSGNPGKLLYLCALILQAQSFRRSFAFPVLMAAPFVVAIVVLVVVIVRIPFTCKLHKAGITVVLELHFVL